MLYIVVAENMLVENYTFGRQTNHYNFVLSRTVSLGLVETIQQSLIAMFSGHQTDLNHVTILSIGKSDLNVELRKICMGLIEASLFELQWLYINYAFIFLR